MPELLQKSNSVGQRYSISAEEIKADGVCHTTTVGKVLGSVDERIVSFPLASDIFKVAGLDRIMFMAAALRRKCLYQ